MLEGLKHLLELQRLDSEITRRQEVLAGLPGKRKQAEEALAAVIAGLESAREALQAAELSQRNAESTLQDQEALLVKLESQQYQVKDNTAYTALLSEMDHAKAAISECETGILEAMEVIEAARGALAGAETADADTRARVTSEQTEFDSRQQRVEGELAGLADERALVVPQLAAETIRLYDRIASRRHPALALVSGEMCEGCRVGIPAQNVLEILKGERLITCGNCKRILLHPDMVPGAGGAPPDSESSSKTPV